MFKGLIHHLNLPPFACERSIVAVGATCLGSKCITKLEQVGYIYCWEVIGYGCNTTARDPPWAKYLNSPPIDVLFLFVPAF